MEGELLERETELDALRAALDAAAAGAGAAVWIEGPPGIGKTALLRAAADLAEDRAMRVLEARSRAHDDAFPYGLVQRLLAASLAEPERRAALLAGPAALAAPLTGRRASDEQGFPVLHGLYWLVVNLCAEQPVALLVDDVHEADPPSLRFLAFLAARVDTLPVALVATARGPADGDPALLTLSAGLTATLAPQPVRGVSFLSS